MLRIKLDALIFEAQKYWYRDSLFDGLAYLSAESTCRAVHIIGGELAGEYASPYFSQGRSAPSVDITGFTEEEIEELEGEIRNGAGLSYVRTTMGFILSLDEKPFTGLAYKFFGAYCVRERGYKDGVMVSDAYWNPDGQLLELSFENEVNECYSWYPDGKKEVAWISLVKTDPDRGAERLLHLSLRFSSAGELSSISATGASDALEQLIESHAYFPVRKLSELGKYPAAQRFLFFDDGAHFPLFEELARNNAFRATVELHLPAKFLMRDAAIEAVENMRALRKFSFSSHDGSEPEVASKLKSRRPDLEIEVKVAS